jgi:hypothetical protein
VIEKVFVARLTTEAESGAQLHLYRFGRMVTERLVNDLGSYDFIAAHFDLLEGANLWRVAG